MRVAIERYSFEMVCSRRTSRWWPATLKRRVLGSAQRAWSLVGGGRFKKQKVFLNRAQQWRSCHDFGFAINAEYSSSPLLLPPSPPLSWYHSTLHHSASFSIIIWTKDAQALTDQLRPCACVGVCAHKHVACVYSACACPLTVHEHFCVCRTLLFCAFPASSQRVR